MVFRDLEVGEVAICNGDAMKKIKPVLVNGKYYNAEGPDGKLQYIEDDGYTVIEDDI